MKTMTYTHEPQRQHFFTISPIFIYSVSKKIEIIK